MMGKSMKQAFMSVVVMEIEIEMVIVMVALMVALMVIGWWW